MGWGLQSNSSLGLTEKEKKKKNPTYIYRQHQRRKTKRIPSDQSVQSFHSLAMRVEGDSSQ